MFNGNANCLELLGLVRVSNLETGIAMLRLLLVELTCGRVMNDSMFAGGVEQTLIVAGCSSIWIRVCEL